MPLVATGAAGTRPAVDETLTRSLVDAQFPQWAELPLTLLDPAGCDHVIYRLGEELSVGVLDMSSMGTSEPGGYWSSDALHPSDEGHREMARLATAYLRAS